MERSVPLRCRELSAKKINVTGANGMWKSWIAPQTEFERALVKDRCSAIKS